MGRRAPATRSATVAAVTAPPPGAPRSSRRGAALTALAALAAAVYALAFRASGDVPRESFALAVLLSAATLNAMWVSAREGPAALVSLSRREVLAVGAMAVCTAAANVAVALASATLPSAAIAVLFQTEIFFVAIAAYAILGERPGRGVFIGAIVATAGVAVARGSGAEGAWAAAGVAWGLAAAVAFAALLVLARAFARDIRVERVNGARLCVAAPLAALVPGAVAGLSEVGPVEWAAAAVAATAGPVASRLLQMYAVRELPATDVKLGLLSTVLFAYALEAALFARLPAPIEALGATLIATGVALPLVLRRGGAGPSAPRAPSEGGGARTREAAPSGRAP